MGDDNDQDKDKDKNNDKDKLVLHSTHTVGNFLLFKF